MLWMIPDDIQEEMRKTIHLNEGNEYQGKVRKGSVEIAKIRTDDRNWSGNVCWESTRKIGKHWHSSIPAPSVPLQNTQVGTTDTVTTTYIVATDSPSVPHHHHHHYPFTIRTTATIASVGQFPPVPTTNIATCEGNTSSLPVLALPQTTPDPHHNETTLWLFPIRTSFPSIPLV